ncbi:hypothetical protein ABEF95_001200 [Exophiala dermatitidis]|uniref:Alkaline phosphatase n=1 Tax=Exophiala dermatitidis (strain ATCC 34100 / CBS 525.76 / NIH/UT8656) TaxID=858893 RepID=H6BZ03_EXODN|nr:alkaline phosphatase [Exophiala dermatitidis NIH/UT8656]EHY56866.1 alkaline phosphatase [Exophiala dermatitidis NIH/UT8656]
MRAPSTDLLKALRLATTTTSLATSVHPTCLAARHTIRPSNLSTSSQPSNRTFRTSAGLLGVYKSSGRDGSSSQRADTTNATGATAPNATTNNKTATTGTSRTVTLNPSTKPNTASTSIKPPPRSIPNAASQPPSQPHPQQNLLNPRAPRTHDRGPVSEEDTQTDFERMDILANAGATAPATSIDACIHDGFHLNNGVQTRGGLGVLLLDGEAFVWAPWKADTATPSSNGFDRFLDPRRGILSFPPSSLGIFDLVFPKPDLLIIGTGGKLWMLSRETRKFLSEELGIRVDVMDTANAAAAYNLLATERGVKEVAGLMIPDGFVGA